MAQLEALVGELDEPRLLRVPHYESADELPRVPTVLWWRLLRLLITRGEHLHPCAARMAQHAALEADKRGRIDDINAFLDKYAAKHLVTRRTAWIDLDRLLQAGWIRQALAPCPGRKARYALAADLAALPDDLPKDLAAEVRRHVDNPITIAKGGQTKAAVDENLADCEVVRHGSATRREPIMTAVGCGRLHTSPYTREGLPPPLSHPSQESHRSRRRQAFGGKSRSEEEGDALYFVQSLAPDWAQQRGGEVLADAELAEIAHLVMLLLRHMPPSEARELLTRQVATAADLAGVLRWRIGRALAGLRRAARRASLLGVDDDGARHAAWLAANAARNAANAGRRAELVDLAERLRLQASEPRIAAERARLDVRTAPRDASRPSEALSGLRVPFRGHASSNPENAVGRQAGNAATPRITITPPPTVDVDDDGARHAALLAANAERNAATAVRRAELVERARAIAERRAGEPTSTRPRPAGVKPALADRLAALLAGRSGGTS
ncbi:hypothetical protein ACIBQX_49035 [Nonomuraea sp. NPDC049714]|uniref:hypothetical protein n=1 Tax=Nonomuraea sp. NPDC049714 TaxID=3364357 RepID=UPI00379592C2